VTNKTKEGQPTQSIERPGGQGATFKIDLLHEDEWAEELVTHMDEGFNSWEEAGEHLVSGNNMWSSGLSGDDDFVSTIAFHNIDGISSDAGINESLLDHLRSNASILCIGDTRTDARNVSRKVEVSCLAKFGVMKPHTKEQWLRAIRYKNTTSAPGLSGLSYAEIKCSDEAVQWLLGKLCNLTIITGVTPTCWHHDCYYMIPKKSNDPRLTKQRPLALTLPHELTPITQLRGRFLSQIPRKPSSTPAQGIWGDMIRGQSGRNFVIATMQGH
jgi:hypothetical protein